MSDFLTELRGDLVDAHARYGRRGRAGRLARPVHPRTWRPAAILGAVVAAAAVFAGVLVIRTIPQPAPAAMHVVDHIAVRGYLSDGTVGSGDLWTLSPGLDTSSIIQVDPADGRIVRTINIAGGLDSITAGDGALWATSLADATGKGRLLRIDPQTGDVSASRYLRGYSAVVAAGNGAAWLLDTQDSHRTLERLDPATGRTIATIPLRTPGDAIAIGGDSLWTLDSRGVLTQRNPTTGQALRHVVGLGRSAGSGEKVLTADATGVWAVRPGVLVRVPSGGGAERRIPLPVDALTVFAADGGDLWLARTVGAVRSHLLRFDRGTGEQTGSLDLGSHQPQALVPSPRGLWVVCADGTALLVR